MSTGPAKRWRVYLRSDVPSPVDGRYIWREFGNDYTREDALATVKTYREFYPHAVYRIRKRAPRYA